MEMDVGVCREEGRLSRRWGWEWLEQRNGCIQGPWGFSVAGGCCVHSGCILPQPSSPQREVGGQSGRGGLSKIWSEGLHVAGGTGLLEGGQ